MLVVFSPIFVRDTKIISRYDFVAPLMENFIFSAVIQLEITEMIVRACWLYHRTCH